MPTRYLITVGINDYEFQPLQYCVKDSRDIRDTFHTYCNVEEQHIYSIESHDNSPNADPYQTLLQVFERIKSKFVSGEDSLFFYFSGHGIQSGNSTALAFKQMEVRLQDLFQLFIGLNPRFLFFLVDSCYSGVGIQDSVDRSDNAVNFSQQLRIATGYNIICASAADAPAKESSDIKNGRLTRLFIDIIKNRSYYHRGILNLSKVFQVVDDSFKENPSFRQFPFSQTKGLSTYPIAYEDEATPYFATHYIDKIEDYDWEHFKEDLRHYTTIKNELIHEFTRLVRELLRNSLGWSKAGFLKVEIGRNTVAVIDNSGRYFDIFNLPEGIRPRGGARTAYIFKEHYSEEYAYSHELRDDETIQIFSFNDVPFSEDSCTLLVKHPFELIEFQRGRTIHIPEQCEEYSIVVGHGFLDLSTVNQFIEAACKSATKSRKKITITIDKNDKLKEDFIAMLGYYQDPESALVFIV